MPFLIVASPRTGSTLLIKALGCENEIWYHEVVKRRGYSFEKSRREPWEYFKTWRCQGAKIFYGQLGQMQDNYTKLLNNIDHVIWLRRKNLTEQSISLKVAESFGYHSNCKRPENKKISLNVDELKTLAQNSVNNYYAWTKRKDGMSVWYEDLDHHYQDTIVSVKKYLGIPGPPPPQKLKKMRSQERYKRLILNYDEIVQEMGDTYGVPFGKPATLWSVVT